MKDEVRTERQQMNKYIQNEHPDNTELIEDPKDIDLEEVLYAYDSERDGSDADDAPEEERPKEDENNNNNGENYRGRRRSRRNNNNRSFMNNAPEEESGFSMGDLIGDKLKDLRN